MTRQFTRGAINIKITSVLKLRPACLRHCPIHRTGCVLQAALWARCEGTTWREGGSSTASLRASGQHSEPFLGKSCSSTPQTNPRSSFADRLVEAGSVGDGSTGSKVPEPVETCGFCFPGHGSAVQESKGHHSPSCPPGERAAAAHSRVCSTGSAGAIPSPDDGHFKIICSPSQEKTPMA